MTGASRRGAARWALLDESLPQVIDVLVPTAGRTSELAVTLAGLAAQDDPPFRVTISDQSDTGIADADPTIQAMVRVLRAQGRQVRVLRHLPRRGMAEQRQFLLDGATAEFALFLDDDVWLEPGTVQRMHEAIGGLGCGFVGCAVQGLSYLADDRPEERRSFTPWMGPVRPERVRRGAPAFERWRLHNAANLAHQAAQLGLAEGDWLAYRIAWIGGCVLYRRSALVGCGGFGFWAHLPSEHVGEDVAAQWRVMERYGGAGILPSGAVHLEAATALPDRRANAPDIIFGGTAPPADGTRPRTGEDHDNRSAGVRGSGQALPGRATTTAAPDRAGTRPGVAAAHRPR